MPDGLEARMRVETDNMSCTMHCFPQNSANLLVRKAFADAEEAGKDISSVSVEAHCVGQLSAMACGELCGMTALITFGIKDGEDEMVKACFEGSEGTIVVAEVTDGSQE